MFENRDFIQLINTAIVKSKEKRINVSYEERLTSICKTNAIKALEIATKHLAEMENISHDQATLSIIESIRELDSIWSDYVTMEGVHSLKKLLKSTHTTKTN